MGEIVQEGSRRPMHNDEEGVQESEWMKTLSS